MWMCESVSVEVGGCLRVCGCGCGCRCGCGCLCVCFCVGVWVWVCVRGTSRSQRKCAVTHASCVT